MSKWKKKMTIKQFCVFVFCNEVYVLKHYNMNCCDQGYGNAVEPDLRGPFDNWNDVIL